MSTHKRHGIDDLLYLMARLRDPVSGCPWDCEQDFRSLVPYTLEEVYEVVDTIERGDVVHLSEELGDLLFQVVFYARVAEQDGLFDFSTVVDGIVRKLLARHPHVFPDGTLESRRGPGEAPRESRVKEQWETIKQEERNSKGKGHLLADIPVALPALVRAQKIQKRVARVNFDWPDIGGVMAKTREEMAELDGALASADPDAIADEIGDLLFCCVNLARHAGFDAETLLRRSVGKFERRFNRMEDLASALGTPLGECDAKAQDSLWRAAKDVDIPPA
jgi:ATP diphosphatase